ncbi:MAG TPA: Xaa-Pro peptidase family protein [Candidatus Saccharimonadales bacterium]|jgi:Xaa-Pro dipeptidase|nr:Xaa-Pro peptidase family protein [Candidatus Saccharimonadales bacterium]
MDLKAIQSALDERGFDAWLFYDHHHRDPIAYKVLGLSEKLMVTRRWFYLIPRTGEPQKLVHRIEAGHLDPVPGAKHEYSSWQELWEQLKAMLAGHKKLAMQYSPNNLVPYIGLVDAGTIELVRSFGKEIMSSGDLVARFDAAWDEEQIQSHYAAGKAIDAIVPEFFQELGRRARNGGTDEYAMQQWVAEAFRRENLVTDDLPIVGCNANSGNPHYEPRADRSASIQSGDFVLLDIFAKKNTPRAVYYDITWTGIIGTPSEKQAKIFTIVRDARDAGVKKVQEAFTAKRRIAGWEVDDATRGHIASAGYVQYFTHRTGHSIGENIHGNGANIDNLETKDEREIIPNSCFSIEPGIYLPGEFGVRSEVNVLIRNGAAEVTGKIQREMVRI